MIENKIIFTGTDTGFRAYLLSKSRNDFCLFASQEFYASFRFPIRPRKRNIAALRRSSQAPMPRPLFMLLVVSSLLAQLAFFSTLHAQSTDASLTGRMTDPKKAVIHGAAVTVIN